MNAPIAHFIYIGSAMLLQITACRFDCYGITISFEYQALYYAVKPVLLHLLLMYYVNVNCLK